MASSADPHIDLHDDYLVRSRQLLGEALAQVDAVIIIDEQYRVTYLNAKAAAQYEVAPAEALGRPLTDLYQYFWFQPGDEDAAIRMLAETGCWRGENLHLLPSGTILHVEATVSQLRSASGGDHLVAVIRDMTAQKKIEAALHETDRWRQLAFEAAQLGAWDLDLESEAVRWDERCRSMFGLGAGELIDRETILAAIHPQDRAKALSAFAAAADPSGDSFYQAELRAVWPDGSVHWIASHGRVFFDESVGSGVRRPKRLAGVLIDITERKRALEQLRHSEERLRRMMETSQIGIAFARSSGEIIECNDALLQMFGCTREEYAAGAFNWRELGEPADDAYNDLLLQQLQESGSVRPFKRSFRRRDGTLLPAMVSAAGLQDAGTGDTAGAGGTGGVSEHIAFVVDLSELKQAEHALQKLNATLEQRVAERTRELELTNAELQRSNRELDHFAYVASHDLRAPLRAVSNLSTWIAEDAGDLLPPRTQGYIAKLQNRVKRLETLVEDLLLYSRAGRKLHASEWVDTEALVRKIAEMLSPPQGFEVLVEGELPLVRCERIPLETVLRNLIQNAIKHHHRPAAGRVTITARPAEPPAVPGAAVEPHADMVEFCVRDDGPGIAAQYHTRIFEIFQTLKPRDEVEGSGMGLAIVRKSVEHVGGRIWVESAVGEGAAFFFTWPKVVAG